MAQQELHPEHGIRLLLEREGHSDERASYRGAIYTSDAVFEYAVELDISGAAELSPQSGAAAENQLALENLARSIARAASRRAADGLAPWPPRILRWRGPGRQGRQPASS